MRSKAPNTLDSHCTYEGVTQMPQTLKHSCLSTGVSTQYDPSNNFERITIHSMVITISLHLNVNSRWRKHLSVASYWDDPSNKVYVSNLSRHNNTVDRFTLFLTTTKYYIYFLFSWITKRMLIDSICEKWSYLTVAVFFYGYSVLIAWSK